MAKLADSIAYPPIAFRVERAAAYLSISESKFLKLVEEGKMPQPIHVDGMALWDRELIEIKWRSLQHAGEEENTVHAILRKGGS